MIKKLTFPTILSLFLSDPEQLQFPIPRNRGPELGTTIRKSQIIIWKFGYSNNTSNNNRLFK